MGESRGTREVPRYVVFPNPTTLGRLLIRSRSRPRDDITPPCHRVMQQHTHSHGHTTHAHAYGHAHAHAHAHANAYPQYASQVGPHRSSCNDATLQSAPPDSKHSPRSKTNVLPNQNIPYTPAGLMLPGCLDAGISCCTHGVIWHMHAFACSGTAGVQEFQEFGPVAYMIMDHGTEGHARLD